MDNLKNFESVKKMVRHEKIHLTGGGILGVDGKIKKKEIFISGKKIISINDGDNYPNDFIPDLTFDAKNKIISRGFVDCSVKFRELIKNSNTDLEQELNAVAAGGVTNFVCQPDINFPIDKPGLVKMLINRIQRYRKANIHPLGALTKNLRGEQISEMAKLNDAGCMAFTQSNFPISDTLVLFKALQYASTFDFPVWLSPSEPFLGLGGVVHSGKCSTRLGLKGIPVESESISIMTILELARKLDVRIHFCRISSSRGVDLIRQAKSEGLRVTADVCVYHLHLTENDIGDFDTNFKVFPPFRSVRDRDALTKGLIDGTIDCICSDHLPVEDDAKNLPFTDAEAGLIGVEFLLPLTLKWAKENGVELKKALSFLTVKPLHLLGVNLDDIQVGNTANICIFDPTKTWIVNSSNLSTKAKNSPFFGYELEGRVFATIVNGVFTYQEKI